MTDPMTLRKRVATAIYAVNPEMETVFAPDEMKPVPFDDLPEEWKEVCLQEADAAIALITEACAKVAEDVYGLCELDDLKIGWRVSADMIAQRIRQMGKP